MTQSSPESCPLCGAAHEALRHLHPSSLDFLLLEVVRRVRADWKPADGLCRRCLAEVRAYVFALAEEEVRGEGRPGEINGSRVLPTPWRILAHPDFTGDGVTLCFIDSGFYPHPDLVYPKNRIKKLQDITRPKRKARWFAKARSSSWHGTMAAVVAAGSGYLSGGWYRGVVPEAELVLIKTADDKGRIADENIAAALQWVERNHQRYGIRVVNLSVTADDPQDAESSAISRSVEALTEAGVLVVAAVGNDPSATLRPPASAPSALAVGGLDDGNAPAPLSTLLYPSTHGRTLDQDWKPELLAPAIWLAAPILPGTAQQVEAAALFQVWEADDWRIKSVLARVLEMTELDPAVLDHEPEAVRDAVAARITSARYISPHYQHADGTSFAAPIVAAVAAQLFDADPELSVVEARAALMASARSLPQAGLQQGYGLLRPLSAVERVLSRSGVSGSTQSPLLDREAATLSFHCFEPHAERVSLSGDWLGWPAGGRAMTRVEDGHWQLTLELPPPGEYRYKFVIDGEGWRPDPRNPDREPDGHNGFNSLFVVE